MSTQVSSSGINFFIGRTSAMKIQVAILLTVSCLALSTPTHAANPLATDDTGTQGMLKFQVETNAEFGWDRTSGNGTTIRTNTQSLNEVLTVGVLDPLDLALTVPFSWQQIRENGTSTYDQGGLNDISLALKWRFLETGSASLAIKPSITFPSGDNNRGLGNARPAYGATLISTMEFKPIIVSTNIGYTYQSYTNADKKIHRTDLWNLSLSGTAEVLKGLQVATEVGTASNIHKASTDWPTFMTGGFIYSPIENLDLSLGVRIGLTPPETDISLLPGVSFKFP
jgi:hypothetical protein